MLVPKFTITQTDNALNFRINVPYIRVGDAEVHVEGCNFSFYCKPYLLKLHLPHELRHSEDETHCRAVYNPDEPVMGPYTWQENGTLVITVLKAQKGQHFEDLDLTTRLLQPVKTLQIQDTNGVSGSDGPGSYVEVLKSETFASPTEDSDDASVGTPTRHLPSEPLVLLSCPRYGFNRQYSKVLGGLREELWGVVKLPDPDATPEARRQEDENPRLPCFCGVWALKLRERAEEHDFSGDRYLGDLYGAHEDPIYREAMHMCPFWDQEGSSGDADAMALSVEEKEELATLKNREHLIDDEGAILLGLLDLLLAIGYDHRTTGGEPTVESCWTITNLSPSLSWLAVYDSTMHSPHDVVRAFIRRSLTYPYLRVWSLSRRVMRDVSRILAKGKRAVLRCLLQARRILRKTESHYLLNRLFMDDYCVFIQQLEEQKLVDLRASYVRACNSISKGDVGLGLVELEKVTMEQEEEESSDDESDEEEEESADDSSEEEEGERGTGDMSTAAAAAIAALTAVREEEAASQDLPALPLDPQVQARYQALQQEVEEMMGPSGGEDEDAVVEGVRSLSVSSESSSDVRRSRALLEVEHHLARIQEQMEPPPPTQAVSELIKQAEDEGIILPGGKPPSPPSVRPLIQEL